MKTPFVVLVSSLFVLTGCFEGHEGTPQKLDTSLQGVVLMTDLVGVTTDHQVGEMADVEALFTMDTKTPSKIYNKLVKRPAVRTGISCTTAPVSTTPAAPTSQDTVQVVSVGKLSLGTITSNTLLDFTQQNNSIYVLPMQAPLPSTLYFIKGSGHASVSAFQSQFYMPEEFHSISVNQHPLLANAGTLIQKGVPLVLTWNPISAPDDANIIQIIMESKGATETVKTTCQAIESTLPVQNGLVTMTIDSSQIAGLPDSTSAAIHIQRINQIQPAIAAGAPAMTLQGTREWDWPALVGTAGLNAEESSEPQTPEETLEAE